MKKLIFILFIFASTSCFAQGEWKYLSSMPEGKSQHGFETCNRKIYAVGGHDNKKVYEYDPKTNIWIIKADLPITVKCRQSPILHEVNNKLYHIGGYDGDGITFSNEVWEYDPSTDTWTMKAPMPTGREDFGSAVLNNKIYCFGGIRNFKTPLKVLEIYDPFTDSWDTGKADMPDCKLLGDFGAACNGKIYAIGANNSMVGYPILAPVTTVYEYDPDIDTWSIKAPIPVSTCYKEVEVIGNKLYVISGAGAGNWRDSTIVSQKVYEYNTINDTWKEKQITPFGSLGSALAVYKNKIYMCGGNSSGYQKKNSARLYVLKIKQKTIT